MTNVPQFAVPEIFVNDDGESSKKKAEVSVTPLLSPNDIASWNDGAATSPTEVNPSLHHRRRGTAGTIGSPRSPMAGGPISPSHMPSNFSAQHLGSSPYPPLPGVDGQEEAGSADSSRRGSAVSAENVLEVLDNSVWGESIRRSFTTRRSRAGSS